MGNGDSIKLQSEAYLRAFDMNVNHAGDKKANVAGSGADQEILIYGPPLPEGFVEPGTGLVGSDPAQLLGDVIKTDPKAKCTPDDVDGDCIPDFPGEEITIGDLLRSPPNMSPVRPIAESPFYDPGMSLPGSGPVVEPPIEPAAKPTAKPAAKAKADVQPQKTTDQPAPQINMENNAFTVDGVTSYAVTKGDTVYALAQKIAADTGENVDDVFKNIAKDNGLPTDKKSDFYKTEIKIGKLIDISRYGSTYGDPALPTADAESPAIADAEISDIPSEDATAEEPTLHQGTYELTELDTVQSTDDGEAVAIADVEVPAAEVATEETPTKTVDAKSASDKHGVHDKQRRHKSKIEEQSTEEVAAEKTNHKDEVKKPEYFAVQAPSPFGEILYINGLSLGRDGEEARYASLETPMEERLPEEDIVGDVPGRKSDRVVFSGTHESVIRNREILEKLYGKTGDASKDGTKSIPSEIAVGDHKLTATQLELADTLMTDYGMSEDEALSHASSYQIKNKTDSIFTMAEEIALANDKEINS